MGKKGKNLGKKHGGDVVAPPHALPVDQAKSGSDQEAANLRALNAILIAELAKERARAAESDNDVPQHQQQRDHGEVVLPEEPGVQGATEKEAAQPVDDVSVELERQGTGSGEVVLPDDADEAMRVRPATKETDDLPVELVGGGSGKETPWPEKQKFKSLKAVMLLCEESSADAHAEEELPARAVIDSEEADASLRARLAAAEAEKLRALEKVAELEKRLRRMSLSAPESSGSGMKSAEVPAAVAGRGRGKLKKNDKAPAAAGARGRAAATKKPLVQPPAARLAGKPDVVDQAQRGRSRSGRPLIQNTRYSADTYVL